jgi:integrating conjugative element protein (TIGR03755 family)
MSSNNSGNQVDAVSTVAQVEANKGQAGVQWIDGSRRGGSGQEPIRIVNDSTMAGYNALNQRSALANSTISSTTCDGGALCTNWPVAQDAANWAKRVLGEREIRTCQNCEPVNATAGVGLTPLIQETYVTKLQTLEDMLSGVQQINSTNLAKAGSGMLPVSRRVVEALKDDPDRVILSRRLASETAMSDVMEKALLLQRMLQAGARNPNTQTTLAQDAINAELKTLGEEIASLKLEMEIRQSLAMNSASAILRRQEAGFSRSQLIESGDPDRDRVLQMSKPAPGP